MRALFVTSLFFISSFFGWTQSSLSYESFLETVKSTHPVVKQIELIGRAAKADLTMARGSFDPKLYANNSTKNYKASDYFNLTTAGLKWQTTTGVELKAEYGLASGSYLNPENTLPATGLYKLGVTIPVLNGLFTDRVRADLKIAKAAIAFNENEVKIQLNNFLNQAANAYWNWFTAFQNVQIAELGVTQAKIRMDGIRDAYFNGAYAGIDTLETFISLTNRTIELQKAEIDLLNERLNLSYYLWRDEYTPQIITDQLTPDSNFVLTLPLVSDSLSTLLNTISEYHPEIQQKIIKIQQIKFERNLAIEQLKPTLNVQYNWLSESYNQWQFGPLNNNYQFGAELLFPLLLRKERGKLASTQVKLQNEQYELELKQLLLKQKLSAGYFELINYQSINAQLKANEGRYNELLQAEYTKFDIGESSVFMLNSRENKLLEAKRKVAEGIGMYMSKRAKFLANAALLY